MAKKKKAPTAGGGATGLDFGELPDVAAPGGVAVNDVELGMPAAATPAADDGSLASPITLGPTPMPAAASTASLSGETPTSSSNSNGGGSSASFLARNPQPVAASAAASSSVVPAASPFRTGNAGVPRMTSAGQHGSSWAETTGGVPLVSMGEQHAQEQQRRQQQQQHQGEVQWEDDDIHEIATPRAGLARYKKELATVIFLLLVGIICVAVGGSRLGSDDSEGGMILLLVGGLTLIPGVYYSILFYKAYRDGNDFAIFQLPQ